jgi:hypothetical protein
VSLTPDDVDAIVMSFPGAARSTSYGRPSYRIGKAFFTWVRPEVKSLVVRLGSIDERDSLIDSDADVFHITDHYRDYPTVLVRLDQATPALVRAMLERRFRAVATKKLLAEWEARR